MSESILPLSAGLSAFIESGLSMLIGTRGPDLTPESLRGVGIAVTKDGRGLTVFVPLRGGTRTLANLGDNGRIAVTLSRPTTHETIQIKGVVARIEDATEDDRASLDRYLEAFSRILTPCGMPATVTRRLVNWPAVAVTVAIEDVFVQTPGPRAGTRLAGPLRGVHR